MKKICALTMLRDDEFFLRKWVAYYGKELGRENLFVFFDGIDQTVPDFCSGVNVALSPRLAGNRIQGDKRRIKFLSAKAKELFASYDIIIGTDVDEYLAVDPSLGISLAAYLSGLDIDISVSALGVDVAQHLKEESEIDPLRPFLAQRSYAFLSSNYTKASILARPVLWGSGFHRVRWHRYHIDPHLYLFHCGSIDIKMLEKRCRETDRLANGWSEHMKRRARVCEHVTYKEAAEWEQATEYVRSFQQNNHQNFFRGWNKPLANANRTVKIAERFREVL